MKHIRELLILAFAGACLYLFFQWRSADDSLEKEKRERLEEKARLEHRADSILQLKNQAMVHYLNSEANANSLIVENKFLKKLREQDEARYAKGQRNRAPHLADSAITRAWAAYYKY